jgi:hypothetical protein
LSDITPTEQTELARDARLSIRTATRLAWALWAVCVVLIGLALFLDFITDNMPFQPLVLLGAGPAVLMGVLSLAYPTVGALIASRLPSNPVGWIFCGLGLLDATWRVTLAYVDYTSLENLALPGREYAAWFSMWVGLEGWATGGIFLLLLFPDGRLASRRWRIVAWAAVLGAALATLARALMPGPLRTVYYVDNPFGIVGIIGGLTTYDFFAVVAIVGMALLLTSSIAALVSLYLRLRRAQGDERQ